MVAVEDEVSFESADGSAAYGGAPVITVITTVDAIAFLNRDPLNCAILKK